VAYREISDFYDGFAREEDRWLRRTGPYHRLLQQICKSVIPPHQRVLEIGCGRGDLLASLKPSRGVGVDVSEEMVTVARKRHPGLDFLSIAGEGLTMDEGFDYVVMSDLVPYVYDLQALFEAVAALCHSRSRLVISSYSALWRPLLAALARVGVRPRRPIRNWVAPKDLVGLLELAGFQLVSERKEILAPVDLGTSSELINGYVARMPGIRQLALTYWVVARLLPTRARQHRVSVIVPARNESGSIRELVERIPDMGVGTEIVFVEGGSSDDTRAQIEAEIERRPDRNMRLVLQSGAGKWNAVQEGLDNATGDVFVIEDGDMTVAPEDLPKFYAAISRGQGEMINGSRLVYNMEPGAMRFLNMIGNKFFATTLSWVLGQYVKDVLCGTKALHRDDYELIRERGGEFGPEDPFGDFDLLLGAALAGLKISNVPVRYQARLYGSTNIRRFAHGAMLLRLVVAGYRRMWALPVSSSRYGPRPPGQPGDGGHGAEAIYTRGR
jgi:SAM-dependent methyltransferase